MGQQFTITLPDDLAQLVREQVASGTYASVDDFVASALRTTLTRTDDLDALEAWVRTVGVARLREFEADPSDAMTSDEVGVMLERDFGSSTRAA